MPGIIDEFVVSLGLDPSKFTKGQREATENFKKSQEEIERRAKSMESRAQSAGDFFGKLRGQVIALYGAFTMGRGIREFVQDTISTTANLGRMSRTMDISAQELSSWRGAATQMGGSAGEMDQSIYSLTQSLQQFMLTGESSVIPYFRALGISITDVNGKLKTATQLYEEASAKVQGMDPARATALLTSLGANQSMINFLLQGPAKVRAQLAEQAKFAPSAADIKAAQDLQKAWNEVERASIKAGRSILTELAPVLLKVLGYVKDFAEYLAQHKLAATAFFAAISVVVGALSIALLRGTGLLKLFGIGFTVLRVAAVGASGALGMVYRGLAFLVGSLLPRLLVGLGTLTAEAFPALSAAFTELGIAILTTPVGWILAGLAAIGVAGYAIYKHWSDIKHWWHGLWSDMGDDAQSAADRINRADGTLNGKAARVPLPGQRATSADQLKLFDPRSTANSPSRRAPSILERLPLYHGAVTGTGKPDLDAVKELVSRGWSREQAAGIVAHLKYESGLNPHRIGDSGEAYGIGQWHADRQREFARRYGHDIRNSNLAEQLDFVNFELTHGREQHAGALIRGANTVADAVRAGFSYERPANPAASFGARLNIGNSLLSAVKGVASGAYARMAADNSRTSHHSVHIAKIEVMTQATDGRGVGRSIGSAIRDNAFAAQANYGPA